MSNKNNRYKGTLSPEELAKKAAEGADPASEETTPDAGASADAGAEGTTPNPTIVETGAEAEQPSAESKVDEQEQPKAEEVKATDGLAEAAKPVTPVVTITKNATPPAPRQVNATVKVNPNDAKLAKLEALLKRYDELTKVKIPSDATRSSLVDAFYNIADYVLVCDSYAVMDRFYQFFMDERTGIVDCKLALAGIGRITDANKKTRVTCFHAVFFALVRYKKDRVPFKLSIRAIRTALRSDKFCNWLQNKLGK